MDRQALKRLQAKVSQWQRRHGDLARLRAAYRKQLVNLVSHSMLFEQEPVDVDRLQWLIRQKAQNR